MVQSQRAIDGMAGHFSAAENAAVDGDGVVVEGASEARAVGAERKAVVAGTAERTVGAEKADGQRVALSEDAAIDGADTGAIEADGVAAGVVSECGYLKIARALRLERDIGGAELRPGLEDSVDLEVVGCIEISEVFLHVFEAKDLADVDGDAVAEEGVAGVRLVFDDHLAHARFDQLHVDDAAAHGLRGEHGVRCGESLLRVELIEIFDQLREAGFGESMLLVANGDAGNLDRGEQLGLAGDNPGDQERRGLGQLDGAGGRGGGRAGLTEGGWGGGGDRGQFTIGRGSGLGLSPGSG